MKLEPRDLDSRISPAVSRAEKETEAASAGTAFGCPRDFHGHQFVYTVVSPRTRGLSIGVNMNPDRRCNFQCVYCEVDRRVPSSPRTLDVPVMIAELERTLDLTRAERLRDLPGYRNLPEELRRVNYVALSGDGEPTLCPNLAAAVEAIVHLRSRGRFPFFPLALLTNGEGLDRRETEKCLRWFAPLDEVWIKLEAGTPEYFERVNKPDCSLERLVANILGLARRRPVVIQSLFPALDGKGPPAAEIEAYVGRLKSLKDDGARIARVQVCSAAASTSRARHGHLPLRSLSMIAQRVREVAGLKAEVF